MYVFRDGFRTNALIFFLATHDPSNNAQPFTYTICFRTGGIFFISCTPQTSINELASYPLPYACYVVKLQLYKIRYYSKVLLENVYEGGKKGWTM